MAPARFGFGLRLHIVGLFDHSLRRPVLLSPLDHAGDPFFTLFVMVFGLAGRERRFGTGHWRDVHYQDYLIRWSRVSLFRRCRPHRVSVSRRAVTLPTCC